MIRLTLALLAAAPLLAACTTTQNTAYCSSSLGGNLDRAISAAEERLAQGCEYHFNGYFQDLLAIAEANPDRDNPRRFSNHLVRVQDQGLISRRQAEGLYNRYFNVKFVTLQGAYNTCSQTCPVKAKVLADMQAELHDKELGLLRASDDAQSFYRADHLLKETELVLEATCRACAADRSTAGLGR